MYTITSPYSKDPIQVTLTNAIYRASKSPAVQALMDMQDDLRFSKAVELAKAGELIDVPIMVWGWDPLTTMALRAQEGYTWVPSALQPNIPIGPNIANAWNLPSYDPNSPPPGSIKVSVDANDYPPYPVVTPVVVKPVQPASATSIVGDPIGGGFFRAGNAAVVNGKAVVADKQVGYGLMFTATPATASDPKFIADVGNIFGAPSIMFQQIS